ncbi:type II toxin-antitoxin system VapC family toxin [Mitsuaria sp. GD03876]|uniref:type II toxin-antitoxin system VapC family toxin n=1 Tax=Mitsuaria sp. GD03876 TaxID=2975399 RepID=UPI002447D483|nr:type II toxin-antitoxin system VapC family toxin [Mitsuaria sp. GD03876]MDH0868092.1 type II toxin-antitoxin system VapC family toxin [Mitsuaria sp. GD03876]
MKVTVDTNVLVRCVVKDNLEQARAAMQLMAEAEVVVVAVACLCEFAWVLGRSYRFASADIAEAIRAVVARPVVQVNRLAVDAGLDVLDLGGDFADGAIACEGRLSGGDLFMTFDKAALRRLTHLGERVASPFDLRAKAEAA